MPRDAKGKRIRPDRPREVVREELLADPETQRIATSVQMELDDYIELVLTYAYHPEKEVMVEVVPDEELRAAGFDPPSARSVGQFFKDTIAGLMPLKQTKSVFNPKARAPGVLDVPNTPSDTVEDAPKVREDLLKSMIGKKGGNA